MESQHSPEQEVRCEQCGAILKQEETESNPEESVHYYLLKYYE